MPLLKPGGQQLLSLVKPQFEVGLGGLGKGGIVRDSSLYSEVEKFIKACCIGLGLNIRGYFDSSITGGDGNREFLSGPCVVEHGGRMPRNSRRDSCPP